MYLYFCCWLSAPAPDWTKPDKIFYIGVQKNAFRLPRINNVTFRIPVRPFLLQSAKANERIETCTLENDEQDGTRDTQECGDGYCDCSHILNVKLREVKIIVIHINFTLRTPKNECVYYLRLNNSRFCLIWTRINHFMRVWWFYHEK